MFKFLKGLGIQTMFLEMERRGTHEVRRGKIERFFPAKIRAIPIEKELLWPRQYLARYSFFA